LDFRLVCSHACSNVVKIRLRASLADIALKPAIALATASLTFSVPTKTSAICSGQRCSSLRTGAAKPSSTKLLSLLDNSARQVSTQ
jgi:hypothetical protein